MRINYTDVAEYCLNNWGELSNKIIHIADDVCNNTFIFDMPWDMERTEIPAVFKDKIDWNYLPAGDKEFIWQFNRHRFLLILAQAYRLTDNEKYAENFARLISDWITNAPLNSDRTNHLTWRRLEVGLRGEYWTRALRILDGSPALTPELLAGIKTSLLEHAQVLRDSCNGFTKVSNWGVIQDHGLFAIAMYYDGEIDTSYKTIAIERLTREIRNQLMTDGVHWEQSCMYHSEVLMCLLDTIINARLSGFTIPGELESNAKRMLNVVLAWKKPDHCHPLMGDSDNTDVRDILTQGAYLFKDGALKFGGYDILDYESAWRFGETGIDNYISITATAPPYNSIALADSGNYIMRNNYSEHGNYLHFINGYTGGGHGHADKLHFDLTINGDNVLTDSGRYTYVPSKIRHELKRATAHNTITVGHKTFLKGTPSGWGYSTLAPSVKLPTLVTCEYELVQGAHLGYHGLIGATYVDRRILWIKPDIYIVLDGFRSKMPCSHQQYFHFDKSGELNVNGNVAEFKTANSTTKFSFVTPNIKLTATNSKISYHYNGLDNRPLIKTNFRGNGITVICGKPNGEKNDITVSKIDLYNAHGFKCPRKHAEGIQIITDNRKYTLFIMYKELMQYVQTKDGKLGAHGQLALFQNDETLPRIIHW